jgi:hypothetical protein
VTQFVGIDTDRLSWGRPLMTNEDIVAQFKQVVDTLQRIVNASGELASRVEFVEQRSGDVLGLLTSIQGHLHVLLEQFEKQEREQAGLKARIEALEARK